MTSGSQTFCEGDVILIPEFLSVKESARLFEILKTEIHWKHEPIKIFGKLVMQPRLTAWYGDAGASYRYSGVTKEPISWTDTLREIKSKIELETRARFNGVLLNQYRDQNDSMGWHRDNEKELGSEPVIASLSLGDTRRFLMRPHSHDKKKTGGTISLDLTPGSLLIMKGKSQSLFEHSLPKTSKPRESRINLTFRLVYRMS